MVPPSSTISASDNAEKAQNAANLAWGKINNIGDIFYTARLDTKLNGAVECNGTTYNSDNFSGQKSIITLLSDNSLAYVSFAEYVH